MARKNSADQVQMPDPASTVRMVRDEPAHPGGPTAADVHPDEVEGWAAAGWRKE